MDEPEPEREPTCAERLVALERLAIPLGKACLRLLARLKEWFWEGALARLMRLLVLAVVAAGILVGLKVVPALYGRYALAQAAGNAARQSLLLGTAVVQRRLAREAFNQGFPEAALDPELFQVEQFSQEGAPQCAVSYDFVHVLDFYGFAQVPLPVRARVEAMPVVPDPTVEPLSE